MAEMNAEDKVIKAIHDAQKQFVEDMHESLKSRDEAIDEGKRRWKDIQQDVADIKKKMVPATLPLDQMEGRAVTQKDGLFNGKMRLPYQKAIGLSKFNPILKSNDAERLETFTNFHDAVTLRIWREQMSNPHQGPERLASKVSETDDFKMYASLCESYGYAKADEILNPTGGAGANLDFTLLSSQLIDLIRLSLTVAAQFKTIPLTRAKQDFPALRGDVKAILGSTVNLPAQDTADLVAVPNTNARLQPTFGQVAFAVEHALGFIIWNDDMFSDSVVPFLPLMREQAAIMIQRAWDQAMLDGDVAATQDSDTGTYDFIRAWDGLRFMSENNWVDHSGAGINLAAFQAGRKALGKYGKDPSKLVMFIGMTEWYDLLTDTNLSTVDKIGLDRATLRTGVIDKIEGVDVVVSEFVRDDLFSTGKHTGTETHTGIYICNRERFWHGQKGDVKVERVRYPASLSDSIQADVRSDFQAIDKDDGTSQFAASDDTPVTFVYNIAKS